MVGYYWKKGSLCHYRKLLKLHKNYVISKNQNLNKFIINGENMGVIIIGE